MTQAIPKPDFNAALTASGVPTTEKDLKAAWLKEVADAGSSINNDSRYSPFWRSVTTLITKPVLWMTHDVIIKHLMPQFFLATVTEDYIDSWAWGRDVTRKQPVATVGTLNFTRAQTLPDVTIPVGTRVQSPPINKIVYELTTTSEGIFPAGSVTCQVPAKATKTGSSHNLDSGYYSVLPAPLDGIDGVTNPEGWITTLGADKEDIDAFRWRIRNSFNRLGFYHTDGVYRALMGEFPGVDTRYIWFEYDAPRGPGTANAFILFELDAPAQTYIDAIDNHIREKGFHGHGDDLVVAKMPETSYDLTVTVWPVKGLLDAEKQKLKKDTEDAIRAAFRENKAFRMTPALPYNRFSFSLLDKELHSHLPNLESIEFGRSDIVSQRSVPTIGNLTVNLGS
uniref:Uncharacterized phage protein gp47/JayE n=1 Tax=Candidatus Kentrum sp. LFY TaxID=2126342 RepID=A0A450WI69_9GAMM|nr:MAG: Uncharacterized phage protein gp47/JayE [Candidatus Kentron sp. LFY]